MDDTLVTGPTDLTHVAVELVAAYVSTNSVRAADLPGLIIEVYRTLMALSTSASTTVELEVGKATPAQIRKSIAPEALISFIDGKPYKTLKRHLTVHGLDFQRYRIRYGLPANYPNVASNYSEARSALAKTFGLGKQRRRSAQKAA